MKLYCFLNNSIGIVTSTLVVYISLAYAACPSGSLEWNSRCYLFEVNKNSFVAAEERCVSNDGHLVSIHDEFVNMFLTQSGSQIFADTSAKSMWIGAFLSSSSSNPKWTWADKSDFNYVNWDKGEPNNSTNDDCVSINLETGKWQAEDCFKQNPSVCVTAPLPPINYCPLGFVYYEPSKSCFGMNYRGQRYPIVTTWPDANEYCKNNGGELPSFHDLNEFYVLQAFIISSMKPIWIGLKSTDFGSTWTWSDGSVVDYLPWQKDKGFPLLSMETSCGIANITFIENQDCSTKAWVICKQLPY